MSSRRHSLPSRGRSQGFTLLEMLLAFVVFSLGFATVLEIMSGSMRNTMRARHYSEVALTAQSLMDQVGLEIPLEDGFGAGGKSGEYEWELEIHNYVNSEENIHSVELAEMTSVVLLQVDLVISWGKPPREQSRHFTTIRSVLATPASRL